jgi:TolA-binding protein
MAVQHKEQKTGFENKLTIFLTSNKKLLIIIAAVIVVAVTAVGVTVSVLNSRLEKHTAEVELLQEKYVEIMSNTAEQADGQDGQSEGDQRDALTTLSEKVSEFINSTGNGYPRLRALYLQASVSYQLEDYSTAAVQFSDFAKKYKDSHLAPTALMNAGASYETAGDMPAALEQYRLVFDLYKDSSAEAPHALFSVGRLYERQGNISDAISTYRELSSEFPESEWAKLGVSRLIVLE